MVNAKLRAAADLVAQMKPLLSGKSAEVQGAALADLLSIWLAGHIVPADTEKTDQLRGEMLGLHIMAVLELVPESELEIFGGHFGTRRPQ